MGLKAMQNIKEVSAASNSSKSKAEIDLWTQSQKNYPEYNFKKHKGMAQKPMLDAIKEFEIKYSQI